MSKEFPDVTFRYTIEGETIKLWPLIPDCTPGCIEGRLSVAVAYPGDLAAV